MLPKIEPMELIQQASPFDHDEWLFEIKHDGFRALAYVEDGDCRLVSRNDLDYRRFTDLMAAIPRDLNVKSNAILDGELVVLDDSGRAQFYDLIHARAPALFAAFDLVWLDGDDFRELPLFRRKQALRKIILKRARRTFFVDHIAGQGKPLYQQICDLDMEGIVCRPLMSPYRPLRGKTTWIKVKNPNYSQAEGRHQLFNSRRKTRE